MKTVTHEARGGSHECESYRCEAGPGPRADRCPLVTHGAEVRPAWPRPLPSLEPSGAQREAERRGRGRLSTRRLAPAWPGPRGRAASSALSPPAQQLTPQPGRDTPPAPPPAAGTNTSTYPRPVSILQSTPARPAQTLGFPSAPLSSHCRRAQHARSTPSATLSSHWPASSTAPSRGPAGPQPLLSPAPVPCCAEPDAGLGSVGDRERLLLRAQARTHTHTRTYIINAYTTHQHTAQKHTSNTHTELTHAKHVTTNTDTQHTSNQHSSHTQTEPAHITNHTHPAHRPTQSTNTHTQTALPKHMQFDTHNTYTTKPHRQRTTQNQRMLLHTVYT